MNCRNWKLILVGAGIMAMAMCTIAQAGPPEVLELIVRFNHDQPDVDTPEALVESVNKGNRQALKQKLNHPRKARHLIRSRRKRLQKIKGPKRPKEKLQEYMILSYPNRKALEKAKKALKQDPQVLWVGENKYIDLSVVPSDPLYTVGGNPDDYQWGMHSLDMGLVWDYTRGHAYISPLDTGIEVGHPDLQDNFRNHFSYDFGSNDTDVDELGNGGTYAGHGTHVAGILAGSSNNSTGVVGACWNCSLMIGKIATVNAAITISAIIDGLTWMADTGVQVISMSFGGPASGIIGADDCGQDPGDPLCLAIGHVQEMDVVMAAAAGNESTQAVDFPASDSRVIAVGVIDNNHTVPTWSSDGPEKDLVTPGVDTLSTFYTNRIHNDNAPWNCADYISGPVGYGPCTGTSMATPHAAGVSGVLRSVNPLLTRDNIKDLLISYASRSTNPDNVWGYGIPDVLDSVQATLGTVGGQVLVNRVTPLFSLYSSTGEDYYYTTVPQMAMAAIHEQLQPQPPAGTVRWYSTGPLTPGYSYFPIPGVGSNQRPRASAYIFTTHRNPLSPGSDLVPLYRLSYQGDYTGNNPLNVDHVYTTEQAGIDLFESIGYQLDGTEGYIFPDFEPQPAGTVKLYRKYNVARDDHAIFPETELSSMIAQGYTENSGNEWIGYVFLNQDSDNDGLIDGFEQIIGTDINDSDSDNDGKSDGAEVNNYPYSDPLDTLSSPFIAQLTPNAVTHAWYPINFPTSFSATPILLARMQTFDGGDTAGLRIKDLTQNGLQLFVEEEQSLNTEMSHTTEIVGYFALESGLIRDSNNNVIGEAGFVTGNTSNNADWKTVNLSQSYSNAVVMMNMTTFNGSNPTHIRLKDVTSNSFKYQLEEWDYLDQSHTSETMAYVVLKQGAYNLADGKKIRIGTVSTDHNWVTASYQSIGGTPVVLSQSQTYNGGQAVVTRQKNPSSTNVQLRLQEEEGNDGTHLTETIGYIAIEQGS